MIIMKGKSMKVAKTQNDPMEELFGKMGEIFGAPIKDRTNMYTEDK